MNTLVREATAGSSRQIRINLPQQRIHLRGSWRRRSSSAGHPSATQGTSSTLSYTSYSYLPPWMAEEIEAWLETEEILRDWEQMADLRQGMQDVAEGRTSSLADVLARLGW